ncbi:sulfotransferase family 2 domain-containing protein [Colwellia hornerae]|uniref:Sulfotransferase family protein n=1 Tax=Colwellia hornerae TaxID=89402 RepID=A0A5C6QHA0_9GAMM|nr:sulfotransferase family 2 domain-containing protein [Colwellia hornerae]TWX52492.1 sulfotransferase family protein [Colwellia hornerae]TWX58321.1 sulfotransferase family protein [Colwellia hornerae]TWX68334.1 sulfotransferase family protein [Colwellia hornerae]
MSSVFNNVHGFYFLHIPKTAGRAVEDVLKQLNGSLILDVSSEEKKRGIFNSPFYAEQSYTELRPIKNILHNKPQNTLHDWMKLYKFCFVRNPYDRAYSAYKYCMRTAKNKKRQPFGDLTPENISFREFIRLPKHFNYEIHNHFHITQTEYMMGYNTDIDYVGKLETIEKDLHYIAEKIGVNFPPLKKKNVTEDIKNKSSMGNEDKLLIEKLFKADFVNFDYELTSLK